MRRKWINNSRDPQIRPTYLSWRNMRMRCRDLENPSYGGRGISVCERWKDNFDAFYEDMGERPKGKTLERVDNDGDYTPENCVWATPKEQGANRRTNLKLTIEGKTKIAAEWGREYGLSRSAVSSRLHKDMPLGPRLRRKIAEHGTTGMYDTHNCRCEACKKAKSEADRRRYLNRARKHMKEML